MMHTNISRAHPWLTLLILFSLIGLSDCQTIDRANNKVSTYSSPSEVDFVKVSIHLLENVKEQRPTDSLENILAKASEKDLLAQLSNDARRKAFWFNVYNAYTQIKLRKEPKLYENRGRFFKLEFIVIAGYALSLDIIEHDFLRKSKIKISLGYLSKPFVGEMIKKFRVDRLDYRMHFALNCGAASCPLVRIYHPERIDEELAYATSQYLSQTSVYEPREEKLSVTPLMSWFRADFGGKRGIRKIHRRLNLIPPKVKPKVDFISYDWEIKLDAFANGPTPVNNTSRK